MFGLISIEDQIHVSPNELSQFTFKDEKGISSSINQQLHDPLVILRNRVNEKYLNRIVKNAGLMIYFVGFEEIGHAEIDTDNGGLLYSVSFKMIVFKPYIGEIIEGIIINSDSTGLTVSLGFFSDIKIPCNDLREPKSVDINKKIWSWDYENHKLPYYVDSMIRFKVSNIIFNDQGQDIGMPSMVVVGNVQNDGLGMTSWWS
ncbi:RNA polymerase Rpb7, N-terminal domain-containing protein [Cryptosporidium felis]|nr:RNA polymerase Rpb7, N-terminal domain-containing protein [Cryptosporidium felis]